MELTLVDLAEGVLSQIVSLLGNYRVLSRLQLCGNSRLWSKLVASCVNVVYFTPEKSHKVATKVLPSFPKLFELHITWESGQLTKAHLDELVMALPNTLREIYFTFDYSCLIWTRQMSDEERCAPGAFLCHTEGRTPLIMKERFPYLTHLQLLGQHKFFAREDNGSWTSTMKALFLRGLPASLVLLQLSGLTVESHDDFSILPPELTSLHLVIAHSFVAPTFPPSLAESLRHLRLETPKRSIEEVSSILPRHLQSLNLFGPIGGDISGFPSTLKKLHLTRFKGPYAEAGGAQTHPKAILADFPPNLHTLSYATADPSFFFSRPDIAGSDGNWPVALPKTLTSLASNVPTAPWDWKQVPETVTNLRVSATTASVLPLAHLTRLETLQLPESQCRIAQANHPSGKRCVIPSSVTDLHGYSASYPPAAIYDLPPRLTAIHFNTLPESIFHLLPKTLTAINVGLIEWNGSHSLPLLGFPAFGLRSHPYRILLDKQLASNPPVTSVYLCRSVELFPTECGIQLFAAPPFPDSQTLRQSSASKAPWLHIVEPTTGELCDQKVAPAYALKFPSALDFPLMVLHKLQWPPSVTAVYLCHTINLDPLPVLAQLPNLQFLDCGVAPVSFCDHSLFGGIMHTDSRREIAWPASLTHLGVRSIHVWSSSAPLPPSLTSFQAQDWVLFERSSPLPTSLTSLHIQYTTTRSGLLHLTALQTLQLRTAYEVIPALPLSLTSLNLQQHSSALLEFMTRCIQSLQSLTALVMPSVTIDWTTLSSLPALTTVNVSKIVIDSMEIFIPLLQAAGDRVDLTKDALTFLRTKIPNLTVAKLEGLHWYNILLRHLPSHVTSLKLGDTIDKNLGASLPAGLLDLNLRRATGATHVTTHALPRGLTSLKIKCCGLGVDDIKRIPRSVTRLGLFSMNKCWPVHLAALPPNLTALCIDTKQFSKATIAAIPRNLRHFHWASSTSQSISSLLYLFPRDFLTTVRLCTSVPAPTFAAWLPPTVIETKAADGAYSYETEIRFKHARYQYLVEQKLLSPNDDPREVFNNVQS